MGQVLSNRDDELWAYLRSNYGFSGKVGTFRLLNIISHLNVYSNKDTQRFFHKKYKFNLNEIFCPIKSFRGCNNGWPPLKDKRRSGRVWVSIDCILYV